MNFKEYWDRFATKMPTPRQWSVDATENGYQLSLPNNQTVEVVPGNWNWGRKFQNDPLSTRLWFECLAWLPALGLAHGDWESVSDAFRTYGPWISKISSADGYRQYNSQDHAIAVQLKVAASTLARSTFDERARVAAEAAEKFLDDLATFVFDPQYVQPNNHGFMVAKSFVDAGAVLLSLKPESKLGTRFLNEGLIACSSILSEVFDETGITNENTPFYQGFYLHMVSDLISFCEFAEVGEEYVDEWKTLVEMGTETLQLMLREDGSYPPVGDEWGRPSGYDPAFGELFSKENGCFYFKDDETTLSIISGCRGTVHKQADDTSIRLAHKGKDLLVDCGLLSYDPNDPIAAMIQSQRGHSGLFFPRFDRHRGVELFRYGTPRVRSEIDKTVTADGLTKITCRSEIDEKWKVEREYVLEENHIRISDQFEAPNSDEYAIQRFVLHEDSLIEIDGNLVRIQNGDVRMRITLESEGSIRVKWGVSGDSASGWRVLEPYQKVPTHVIEISPSYGRKTIETSVDWGSAETYDHNYTSEQFTLKNENLHTVWSQSPALRVPDRELENFTEYEGRWVSPRAETLGAIQRLISIVSEFGCVDPRVIDFSGNPVATGLLLARSNARVEAVCSGNATESGLRRILELNPSLPPISINSLPAFASVDPTGLMDSVLIADATTNVVESGLFLQVTQCARPIVFFGSTWEQIEFRLSLPNPRDFEILHISNDQGVIYLPTKSDFQKVATDFIRSIW